MSNIYYVYAYIRRISSSNGPAGSPYYIGKGSKKRAYLKHYYGAKNPKDKRFIIKLYDNLTELEAFDIEKYLIKLFGRLDLNTGILRNLTDGGDGVSGRIISDITRQRMSESRKQSITDEFRMNLSIRNTGKPRSEETRKKISNTLKGRKLSEETIQKRSQTNTGSKRSEETKKKISDSKKGKPRSQETKEKISNSLLGRKRIKLSVD